MNKQNHCMSIFCQDDNSYLYWTNPQATKWTSNYSEAYLFESLEFCRDIRDAIQEANPLATIIIKITPFKA